MPTSTSSAQTTNTKPMNIQILWVDDEIDLLSAHIHFLELRGYTMRTATNGEDALELIQTIDFDLVFLDENMPGASGLEVLVKIKTMKPSLPVVMITKSEEENIMDLAVGASINDYLIKPVNPKQVLLSIKKHVHNRELVSERTTADYRMDFGEIGQLIGLAKTFSDWEQIYRRLTKWRLQIAQWSDPGILPVFEMQMDEANNEFGKFIKANYSRWFGVDSEQRPMMSHNLFRQQILPTVESEQHALVIIIDNLRFDQWKSIEGLLSPYWRVEKELLFCSILPTSTQYARNALFSGLMPLDLMKLHPEYWVFDEEEAGKNLYEEELLRRQLQRLGKTYKLHFEKTQTLKSDSQLMSNLKEVLKNRLTVLVYNFIDTISHARTEMEMMRQLASDESAYLSLTQSWFKHSNLFGLLREAATHRVRVIITTDHGTIRVHNPVRVIGDRATSTNLRYKLGRNLNYNPKQVYEIKKPEDIHLPKPNVSSSFIFTTGSNFFVYPNNYNHFVKVYRDTFQHGGISMEEMIIPYIELKPIG